METSKKPWQLMFVFFAIGIVVGGVAVSQWISHVDRAQGLALRLAANELLKQDRTEEAKARLHESLVKDPNLYGSYTALGDVYVKEAKTTLAIGFYENALAKLRDGSAHSAVELTEPQRRYEEERLVKRISDLREQTKAVR
jgi:Tfp pilus assembly protein PilF